MRNVVLLISTLLLITASRYTVTSTLVDMPNAVQILRSIDELQQGNPANKVVFIRSIFDRQAWVRYPIMTTVARRLSAVRIYSSYVSLSEENEAMTFHSEKQVTYIVWIEKTHTKAFLQQVASAKMFRSESLWILIMNSDVDCAEFLKDIYVPLDSQLFVIHGKRLMEVYQISAKHSLQIIQIGDLNSKGREEITKHSQRLWMRRSDLQGHEFRITTLEEKPFMTLTKDGESYKMEGYMNDVWKLLQHSMNFTFTVHPEEDNEWGSYVDGRWTGMIGMVHRGEVDIGLASFIITNQRKIAVDYTRAVINTRYRMFIRRPGKAIDWFRFLGPFSMTLWTTILAAMVLVPAALGFIMWFERRHLTGSDVIHLYDCTFYVYGIFCSQGAEVLPESVTARIVFLMTFLMGMMLVEAYSAALTARLAVQTWDLPFHDMQGLLKTGTMLGVVANSAEMDYFKDAKSGILRSVWSKSMLPDKSNFVANPLEGFKRTITQKFAFFTRFEGADPFLEAMPCQLVDIDKDYIKSSNALVMTKGSPYRHSFNYNLHRLEETGQLRRLVDKWWKKESIDCGERNLDSMGFTEVAPLLLFFLSGVVLSSIIFGAETIARRYCKGKKTKDLFTRRKDTVSVCPAPKTCCLHHPRDCASTLKRRKRSVQHQNFRLYPVKHEKPTFRELRDKLYSLE